MDNPMELDLNKCPGCGGPADNGNDRCVPPSPYYCTRCENKKKQRMSYCSFCFEEKDLVLGDEMAICKDCVNVLLGDWEKKLEAICKEQCNCNPITHPYNKCSACRVLEEMRK